MSSEYDPAANRRRFLQYLAASPLMAAGGASALAETLLPKTMAPDPLRWGPRQSDHLIKSPKEAINVFDLEPVCRQNVPPAHFGYMASGIDDEVTLRANREGFLKFQFRPRRLVDVSKVDMSVDILGTKYSSPIVCAPVGGQRSFHDDAESGVARAAKAGDHLQILSTMTSDTVEDVTKARGAPIWMQLYATNKWEVAAAITKRAENVDAHVDLADVDQAPRPQLEFQEAFAVGAQRDFIVDARGHVAEMRRRNVLPRHRLEIEHVDGFLRVLDDLHGRRGRPQHRIRQLGRDFLSPGGQAAICQQGTGGQEFQELAATGGLIDRRHD